MIELKYNEKGYQKTVVIEHNNYILYRNKNIIMQFIKKIYDTLDNNDEIFLGNKKINKKDFEIINLIDIASIIEALKYNKGTIIFKYLNMIIDNSNKHLNTITEQLEETLKEVKEETNLNINYELNPLLSKIINNNCLININYDIKEVNNILKQIMKHIISNNKEKIFIIFIDNSLIKIEFNDKNVYTFNIGENNIISNYNLLFIEEYINFNYDLLYEEIKNKWPEEYKEELLTYHLNNYINFLIKLEEIDTNDRYIINISKIVSQLYNYKQKIIIPNNLSESIEIL